MWMAGETAQVTIEAGIPEDMPMGQYKILLHLSDPEPTLHDRPEYAIRLANSQVWEASTGYNSLLHSIIVDETASGSDYEGDLIFAPIDDPSNGVIDDQTKKPSHFALKGNYPNPFNGSTVIKFDLYRTSAVILDIININGKIVANLTDKEYQEGSHEIHWTPGSLSSGTYIYRLTVDGMSQTGKAIYIK